jgi:vacuolar protein sorting-associated protein 45
VNMNVIAAVKFYVDKIVSDVRIDGMKVLLLDTATTQIVSMVYSQSQIMEKEVYLVELLNSGKTDRMPHLKAAVFIQPTPESVTALCRELTDPRSSEYHVFFSNVVHQDLLQQLAAADGEHEVVRQVQEYYADYAAVNEELFTANARRPLAAASAAAAAAAAAPGAAGIPLARSLSALLSALLSLKRRPSQIRYSGASQAARKLATEAGQLLIVCCRHTSIYTDGSHVCLSAALVAVTGVTAQQ